MTDRNARVWSGSAWESISSPISTPNAVATFQTSAPPTPVAGQMWTASSTLVTSVYSGTAWVAIGGSSGGGATGGGDNKVFYENDTNVTDNYTITTGKNAVSAGPVEIDSGIIVTVPSGSVWSVV